jgi:hypothetical protein
MSVESTATDPYEVVLADLRAKKAQIEQAINAIEILRGNAPSSTGSAASAGEKPTVNLDIDSPGAFLGMSIADAAKKLLAARRQPLKNPDIAAAFKRGGLVLNSKDAVNTIGSVLTRRANEVGDLVKVDRGTWGLKEWYPGRSFKKGAPEVKDIPKEEGVAAMSVGAAPAGTVASVPFVLTQATRAKLREKGLTDEDIKEMTPGEAQEYLDILK